MHRYLPLLLLTISTLSWASDPSFMRAVFEDSNQARVRGKAPAFSSTAVVNGEFKPISLKDYTGKYLVIVFYPMDFTFVCPTELIAYSDRIEEFRKINCEVVAVSIDSKVNLV